MVETVRAVNFRLVGKEKEGLAEVLQQANYMVKLRCLANYEDIFFVAKDLGKSHTLPRQENIYSGGNINRQTGKLSDHPPCLIRVPWPAVCSQVQSR